MVSCKMRLVFILLVLFIALVISQIKKESGNVVCDDIIATIHKNDVKLQKKEDISIKKVCDKHYGTDKQICNEILIEMMKRKLTKKTRTIPYYHLCERLLTTMNEQIFENAKNNFPLKINSQQKQLCVLMRRFSLYHGQVPQICS